MGARRGFWRRWELSWVMKVVHGLEPKMEADSRLRKLFGETKVFHWCLGGVSGGRS